MKFNKLKYLLFVGLFCAIPSLVFAQFAYALPVPTFTNLAIKLLGVMWKVFFTFAVVCFVISGILFLTAMGDPGKLKTARNSVIFGVIGIVVGLLAYSVVGIVQSIF